MLVHKHHSLKEVQENFNNRFPHLKLEFYRKLHDAEEGSLNKDKLSPDTLLDDVSDVSKDVEFSVKEDLRISDIEQHFAEVFGIAAQVFYKSGNVWLQTTATDDRTLGEHEQKAKKMEDFRKQQMG